MRKIALVMLVALSLGGCASWQKISNAWDVTTNASVSPQAVIIAVNSFDAVESTATAYLSLPRCGTIAVPICRDPKVTAKLVPAIRAGRDARDALIAFAQANPGALGPTGLYNALIAAVNTINAVEATLRVQ